MYVYIQSEKQRHWPPIYNEDGTIREPAITTGPLWTVGFYDGNGEWVPESDYDNTKEAAERVHYLNGGIE